MSIHRLLLAAALLALAACANPGTSPYCPTDADNFQMTCPDQGGGTGAPHALREPDKIAEPRVGPKAHEETDVIGQHGAPNYLHGGRIAHTRDRASEIGGRRSIQAPNSVPHVPRDMGKQLIGAVTRHGVSAPIVHNGLETIGTKIRALDRTTAQKIPLTPGASPGSRFRAPLTRGHAVPV